MCEISLSASSINAVLLMEKGGLVLFSSPSALVSPKLSFHIGLATPGINFPGVKRAKGLQERAMILASTDHWIPPDVLVR